ncbi:hypothetical protein Avbf_19177 [Armadillidium vulgare]|nr:hypothetical protein Avbf_19177 [Armadillidium vulgare]
MHVINGLMAIGSLAGAIEPSVTSALLKQGNGWNKVFYLTIILNIISCFVYVIFMTADPQPWNSSQENKDSIDNKEKEETYL